MNSGRSPELELSFTGLRSGTTGYRQGRTQKPAPLVPCARIWLACHWTMNCELTNMQTNRPKPSVAAMLPLIVIGLLVALQGPANAQTTPDPSNTATGTVPVQPDLSYTRPTQTTEIHNYLFDVIGPYPIFGAALAAGISQVSNAPPEWRKDPEGYGKRFASDFGIAAVSTTTRYALSEAFGQDALYYRCECTGLFPRLKHAVVSTVTARRGKDGHRVFSIPALVAPYAGTMTAVYGWYPGRYDAMDALRLGNYNLLAYVGANIALEFFYSGPHSLVTRMHLNNRHGAPDPAVTPVAQSSSQGSAQTAPIPSR